MLSEASDSLTDSEPAVSEDSCSPAASSSGADPLEAVQEEDRVLGAVRWPVYKAYYGAVGRLLAPLVLLTVAAMQVRRRRAGLE